MEGTLSTMFDLLLFAPTQPGCKDDEDTSLGEVLESCFPNNADGGWLVWNGLRVPLSYKYDLGIIIHDVIQLVQYLRRGQTGQFKVSWASNTFQGQWQVVSRGGRVHVHAEWDGVSGQFQDPTLLRQALNAADVIEVDHATFLAYWVAVLQFAHQALVNTGYRRQDLEDYSPLWQELTYHMC